MDRVALAVALVLVAVVVAAIVQRRTRGAAPVRTGYTAPDQLDRRDFTRPGAPLVVVLFSSATCDSCAGTWDAVRATESPDVAVQDVPFQSEGDLHARYRIDAVPLVVVADRAGVVQWSSAGPTTADAIAGAVSELLPRR